MPERSASSARHDSSFSRWWHLWIALVVGVAVLYMLSWMIRHPLPEGWDETRFVIRMHRDATIFQEEGLVAGVKAMLVHYRMREPAFRLLALPISLVSGAAPLPLRLSSMAQFLGAAVFVYMTVKLVSGRVAGYVAAALLLLSPVLRSVSVRVYTDPPLYLAIAGSLFFLLRMVIGHGRARVNVCALAIFLGLGALSKLTFGLVLGPILSVVALGIVTKRLPNLRWRQLATACALGALLAMPHYVLNFDRWLGHALASQSGRWDSGMSTFLAKLWDWLGMMASTVLGPFSAALLVLVAAIGVWHGMRHGGLGFTARQRAVVVAGVVGSVPLLLAHLLGQNQHPRLVSPAVVPLVLSLAVLVGCFRSRMRWGGILLVCMLVLQSALMLQATVTSVREFPAQWDWDRLYDLITTRVPAGPQIGYLGLGMELNMPQLEYPWAMRDERVTIHRLNNRSDDQIDWGALEPALDELDVVVTIPDYPGGWTGSNTYNAAFSERLAADSRFAGPEVIEFGRPPDTTAVHVFFRAVPGPSGGPGRR